MYGQWLLYWTKRIISIIARGPPASAALENSMPSVIYLQPVCFRGSLVAQMVKNLPAKQETQVQSQEDPLEKEVTTHSSILAWEITWTGQSMGS